MKTLYIFFFVSCISIFSVIETSAQTSILPLVEINALHISSVKINEIDCDASLNCIQDGFVVNAPYLGLGVRLEQKITPKLNLYYNLTYNRKRLNHEPLLNTLGSDVYYVFNHFLHNIGLSYHFNNFFMDIGGHYSMFTHIKSIHTYDHLEAGVLVTQRYNYRTDNKNYFGYTAGIGYELNRFQLRLAVHQSFQHPKNVEWGAANTDAAPTAISLSAGYRFQLLDKIYLGGRKKGCPTF